MKSTQNDKLDKAKSALSFFSIPRIIGFLLVLTIVFVFLFPEKVRHRWDSIRTNYAYFFSKEEGQIILDAPQLFTRGRLVNDRAIESAWLIEQLRKTTKYLDDKKFGKAQNFELAANHLELLLNKKSTASANAQVLEGLAKYMSSLDLGPNPIDEFTSAVNYRDVVRHARMSTILDDRHDIDGNTIYRLNFSATLLPPRGSIRPAAVEVVLSSPMTEEGASARLKAAELMKAWLATMQQDLSKVISDRSILVEGEIGKLAADQAFKFRKWLQANLRDVIPPYSKKCPVGFSQTRPHDHWNCAEPIIGSSELLDIMSVRYHVADKNFAEKEQKQTPAPSQPSLKRTISFFEALTMIKEAASRGVEIDKHCFTNVHGFLALLEASIIEPEFIETRNTTKIEDNCRKTGSEKFWPTRMNADTTPRRHEIIARFVLLDFLGKELRPIFTHPKTNDPVKLGDLLKVSDEDWGCKMGPCEPVIELKEEFLDWPTDFEQVRTSQGDTPNKNEDSTEKLRHRHYLLRQLERYTDAFTYQVVPYQMVNPVIVAQRTNSNIGASGGKGQASASFSGNSAKAGYRTRPNIIGFGDWGQKMESPQRNITKFGWIVFPDTDGYIDDIPRHMAKSHSVSAMVSVPGWWRNIYLDIKTCWLSDTDLVEIDKSNPICDEEESIKGPDYWHEIRLPADPRSLTESLGINVVRYPYVDHSQAESAFVRNEKEELSYKKVASLREIGPAVEVGREANIIIRGGRLWRSPVVKLGAQHTTLVEVLPDMNGIIAKFNCILPSPGTPGQSTKSDQISAEQMKVSNGKAPPQSSNGQAEDGDSNTPPPSQKPIEQANDGDSNTPPPPQEPIEQVNDGNSNAPPSPPPQKKETLFVITSEGITSAMTVYVRPFTKRVGNDPSDRPCWLSDTDSKS